MSAPTNQVRRREDGVGPALQALADRVGRLVPSHRDPERFHVEKDEIRRELRQLAREVGSGAAGRIGL